MHKITRQKLNHLSILESVPISESNKKETWLLGSCIINLVYALHIPITIALSKKRTKKVVILTHPSQISSRCKDAKVDSAVLL